VPDVERLSFSLAELRTVALTYAHRSELLTVKELAAEWRQHPATIYKKIAGGEIPAVRLGDGKSALWIPRAELERMMSTSGRGSFAGSEPAMGPGS
jgi:excisionase family DNA binding protein